MSTPKPNAVPPRPTGFLRRFIQSEAAGGIILMVVAVLALIVANSPAGPAYAGALQKSIGGMSVLHWINDALMAFFFLVVGLEIKREVVSGQLSTWPNRMLPGLAALGGMVVPALIYATINLSGPETLDGWAIPTATDIAFALGVLSLVGSRVPVSLKVFLTALAIIDDLGAVVIIALFYTENLNLYAIVGAGLVLAVLAFLNRARVISLLPYLLLGALLWYLVLLSGVHATLAGVALALTIPLKVSARDHSEVPLLKLEHAIQPWVTFAIVPVFGFANAGVSFAGISPAALLAPIPLGIAGGLFVGKQIGVFGMTLLAIKAGWVNLPENASWRQIYGVSILCGIGFTMSLFIGALAFEGSPQLVEQAKLGTLAGSLLSAIAGWIILRLTAPQPFNAEDREEAAEIFGGDQETES